MLVKPVVTKGLCIHPPCSSISCSEHLYSEPRAQLQQWKEQWGHLSKLPQFALLYGLQWGKYTAPTDIYKGTGREVKQKEVSYTVRNWTPAWGLLVPCPDHSLLPCQLRTLTRPELTMYLNASVFPIARLGCCFSVSHVSSWANTMTICGEWSRQSRSQQQKWSCYSKEYFWKNQECKATRRKLRSIFSRMPHFAVLCVLPCLFEPFFNPLLGFPACAERTNIVTHKCIPII